MKGIIFNLVEEVVRAEHGEETWDRLLETAGLDGAYTSLGNYPDEHLTKLADAAADALGTTPENVIRGLGEGSMPLLAERFPTFFEGHGSTRSFLLTLNEIIHAEVRKLYPDALVPDFTFETPADDQIVIHYMSPRRLCALAEGFIQGAARLYKEQVAIDQPECMHHGADSCHIHCTFSPGGARA